MTSWNFQKFVGLYNEIARAQSGWNFDPTDDDRDGRVLGKRYTELDEYRTLRQYATDKVVFEQQTGVEGSD